MGAQILHVLRGSRNVRIQWSEKAEEEKLRQIDAVDKEGEEIPETSGQWVHEKGQDGVGEEG